MPPTADELDKDVGASFAGTTGESVALNWLLGAAAWPHPIRSGKRINIVRHDVTMHLPRRMDCAGSG